ncbi:MAG TPA: chorismate-binding protein [Candidatus Methanoperedens sp.]|nr:chorismate-binding protein [Candidatus Methanoperedens sp.]
MAAPVAPGKRGLRNTQRRAPPAAVRALASLGRDDAAGWRLYREPLGVLAAGRLEDVSPLLAEVRRQTERGRVAVGWIAYEAGPAFDAALIVRPPGGIPLAWFALFGAGKDAPAPADLARPAPFTPAWRGGPSPALYREAVARIHGHIAAGETYQVNYTYRLRAAWDGGDPLVRFAALERAQRSRYAAFIDAGRYLVLSASPELCFRLAGDEVTCRPMKGTAARAPSAAEDLLQAERLRASEKERAENVMIVDMVRNDLGRIARAGSVRVPRLWETERYPTLWQMTSTVRAETGAPLEEILAAVFPSASITGAPKVRTMGIIAELERTPRGIYTGCVGVLGPGRSGWMNVAIRTLVVDRRRALAEYGTGSGIVWDSQAGAELAECRTKTLVLGGVARSFRLVETLAWLPEEGLLLLERHLRRLAASADYFGFACDPDALRAGLVAATRGLRGPQRVRLLLDERGTAAISSSPLGLRAVSLGDRPPARVRRSLRVALAREPVRRDDPFLHHKTTRREAYERALAGRPGCDEVILWNAEGEVTEATIANLVLGDAAGLWTPPLECGLLGGTFRADLLACGALRERRITVDQLRAARRLWLISSVRGWRRCRLVDGP